MSTPNYYLGFLVSLENTVPSKKIFKKNWNPSRYPCCRKHVVGQFSENNPDHKYIGILNRGCLYEYVCAALYVLDWTQSVLKESKIPLWRAANLALQNVFYGNPLRNFSFDIHGNDVMSYTNQTVIIITASVVKDRARKLKK